MSENIS
jgi:hypothetical protein